MRAAAFPRSLQHGERQVVVGRVAERQVSDAKAVVQNQAFNGGNLADAREWVKVSFPRFPGHLLKVRL
jgi:hypothetical protein